MTAERFNVLLQTGSDVLIAAVAERVCGVVRRWDEDGIGWFDLLASALPGAGRALARVVEMTAQDRGFRLVRLHCPEGPGADLFLRWGYVPIGRSTGDGPTVITMEKRLPLLTVREQRRSDAAAISAITGEDPWPYEQGARPGCFVLADGERVVGTVNVRDRGSGVAELTEPQVIDAYLGRGLELWMIDRATTYAETRAFHTATLATTPLLHRLKRDLEDRRWFPERPGDGAPFVKALEARDLRTPRAEASD